jgi:hypothetical protein
MRRNSATRERQSMISAKQRCYYFSDMDCRDAPIFTKYDSSTASFTRFTRHAAFALPHAPSNARKRESIEVRCLIVCK